MLDQVFVPFIPSQDGPCNRDLSLSQKWRPFVNAFNTWMDQAQAYNSLAEGLYATRIGCVVTVTGKVGGSAKIGIPKPVETFSMGGVLFSKEGFLENVGSETSLSVSYITKE